MTLSSGNTPPPPSFLPSSFFLPLRWRLPCVCFAQTCYSAQGDVAVCAQEEPAVRDRVEEPGHCAISRVGTLYDPWTRATCPALQERKELPGEIRKQPSSSQDLLNCLSLSVLFVVVVSLAAEAANIIAKKINVDLPSFLPFSLITLFQTRSKETWDPELRFWSLYVNPCNTLLDDRILKKREKKKERKHVCSPSSSERNWSMENTYKLPLRSSTVPLCLCHDSWKRHEAGLLGQRQHRCVLHVHLQRHRLDHFLRSNRDDVKPVAQSL